MSGGNCPWQMPGGGGGGIFVFLVSYGVDWQASHNVIDVGGRFRFSGVCTHPDDDVIDSRNKSGPVHTGFIS